MLEHDSSTNVNRFRSGAVMLFLRYAVRANITCGVSHSLARSDFFTASSWSTVHNRDELIWMGERWSSRSPSSAKVRSSCSASHYGRCRHAGVSRRAGISPACGLGAASSVRRNWMRSFSTKDLSPGKDCAGRRQSGGFFSYFAGGGALAPFIGGGPFLSNARSFSNVNLPSLLLSMSSGAFSLYMRK